MDKPKLSYLDARIKLLNLLSDDEIKDEVYELGQRLFVDACSKIDSENVVVDGNENEWGDGSDGETWYDEVFSDFMQGFFDTLKN